jgi:hypothetical protein
MSQGKLRDFEFIGKVCTCVCVLVLALMACVLKWEFRSQADLPPSAGFVLFKLGSGSFGTVFKVKRKIDAKHYVIKKVNISELSRKEQMGAIKEGAVGLDLCMTVGCDPPTHRAVPIGLLFCSPTCSVHFPVFCLPCACLIAPHSEITCALEEPLCDKLLREFY